MHDSGVNTSSRRADLRGVAPAYAAAVNDEGVRGLAAAAALVGLVVVGLAAAAHPHGAATAWLLLVVAVVAAAVLVPTTLALLLRAPATRVRQVRESRTAEVPWHMLGVAAVLALVAWALGSIHISRPKPLPPRAAAAPPPRLTELPRKPGSPGGFPAGPWIALALGLVVVAVLIAVGLQHLRQRRGAAAVETLTAEPDPLALAVEAALFDLENEADARRAVIQAYASTEQVLREHGLARLPSEAPMEYLERVLRGLGARAGAVDRLTELFEHAAFSTHAVDAGMRAEAVSAFHGLRETLAAPGPARSGP